MMALLKLVPLKDWAYLAAILAILTTFGWYTMHERGIGRAACEAKVAAVEAQAQAQAAELQGKLDEQAAAHDKALHDAITAVPHAVPVIAFGPACKLTAAQLAQINGALK